MNSELSLINENLLQENYAWVDKLLREKYYNYALTIDNYDEFYSAGLLTENYASKLEEIERQTTPIRKRSEDDISDYEEDLDKVLKRLDCQSPIPLNEYIYHEKNKDDDDCFSVLPELTNISDSNYDYVEFTRLDAEKDIYEKKLEDAYDDKIVIEFGGSSNEDSMKVWPLEEDYDYEEDYEIGYKEYYEDDNSDVKGNYSDYSD